MVQDRYHYQVHMLTCAYKYLPGPDSTTIHNGVREAIRDRSLERRGTGNHDLYQVMKWPKVLNRDFYGVDPVQLPSLQEQVAQQHLPQEGTPSRKGVLVSHQMEQGEVGCLE